MKRRGHTAGLDAAEPQTGDGADRGAGGECGAGDSGTGRRLTASQYRALVVSGRLFRTILAGFAEYEREVISERIRAGVVRAKKKGKKWGGRKEGHRTRLTREKIKSVRELLRVGTKKAAVARQLGISERSVYRALEL